MNCGGTRRPASPAGSGHGRGGSEELRTLVEEELGREIGSTKSRLCFFLAEHAASQGDPARCRELLLEGYQHDPNDADLLIGMFRVPGADEAWGQETRTRIERGGEISRADQGVAGARQLPGSRRTSDWPRSSWP